MMLLTRSLLLGLLALPLLGGGRLHAEVSPPSPVRDSLSSRAYTNRLLLEGTIASAPLVGIGLLQSLQNEHVREIRYSYYPHFRRHFDDYLQFAPLVAQVGMRLSGLEGSSQHMLQTFTADALASVSMLAITSAIKYTARVRRPDGSSRNSFPSGHTAMAFTAATLLAEEYGQRYPWVSVAGYGAASLVGVGRLLNNRHWIGDVVTGAGLGILSGHIGYWAADRLFGGSRRRLHSSDGFATSSLQLMLPITLVATRGIGEAGWSLRGRSVGVGVHYTPPRWPIFLEGQVSLGLYRALQRADVWSSSSPEYRAVCLRAGLGYEQALWREFAVQGSLYGILGLGQGSDNRLGAGGYQLQSRARQVGGLGFTLAPVWRLTERVGLRLPLSVEHYPRALYLQGLGAAPLRMSRTHYVAGTALMVYL